MGLFSAPKQAAMPPPISGGADPFGAGGYVGWLTGHASGASPAASPPSATGTAASQAQQAQSNPLLALWQPGQSKSLLGQ